MLRPAKLFHSFHQLRHYVQTKVTELVVAQHPPPFLLPNPTPSSANALTPWAYQTKPLTNGLQRQFPMINKACSPLISGGGPLSSWRPLVAPAVSSWHRGISLGIHGGYQGLGAFRSYSSSTASPFFQAYHSATSSTHSTVFSHLSSGIFAPLTSKMPATTTTTNKQTTLAPPSSMVRSTVQKNDKENRSLQTMGASNKYTSYHLTAEPITTMAPPTTIEETTNDAIPNNDTTPAKFCTEDDLTTDWHSVTVPTTQTCFYITLDLVPTTLDSILSTSKKDIDKNAAASPFESSAIGGSISSSSSSWTPWTKDIWPVLVEWKERQQDYYDQLLTWLQPCLDKGYRIQMVGHDASVLRLYFPNHVKRREQALACLEELNRHVGTDQHGFLGLVELQEDTMTVEEPLAPLGPDYFQGIHLFLTHIDDLVDHGPAFAQSSSV